MNSSSISREKREGSTPSRAFRLLIVGVLGAAVVGVFGVLAWLVFNQTIFFAPAPGAPAPVPESAATTPLSARQAFERALAVTRAWQLDATLSSVTANWHAARLDDLTGGTPAWVVTFYSPSAGEKRSVVVSSESARALAPRRPRGLPPAVDLSQWQVDSQQALALFLEDGGQEFVAAHQPVDVFLTLTLSESGRLQWIAAALDSTGSQLHEVVIDAATGSIE